MTGVATTDWGQAAVERFLIEEAFLLDSRRFEDWMELFTEDGIYWAPARPDQERPDDEISLIYDNRERMATRIRRLRHPRIHAQDPPTRTSRIVTNTVIEQAAPDGAGCRARSKFVLHEYRPSIPQDHERAYAGTCWHDLVRDGDGFKIARKKAVLINCDARLSALFVYF